MIFSNSDEIMTELFLTERQTEFYPRENRPCKRYNPGKDRNSIKQDSSDLIKCGKKIFWEKLKAKINCSITGIEQLYDHPNAMKECHSLDEAEATLGIIVETYSIANKKMWDSMCPVPCIQVSYF